MEEYDKIYGESENVFGKNPTNILSEYFQLIDKTKPVLDVGSGQGRNAIFLAEKGFKVDAVDPSIVAVETLKKITSEKNLTINNYCSSITDFYTEQVPYSAILLFGVFPVLTLNEIEILIKNINRWTTTGTLIFITAHNVKDDKFKRHSTEWEKIGRNSFSLNNSVRTYLEDNEILSIFNGWDIVFHFEGLGPEHSHPGGNPERHSAIDAIFQKR